MNSTELSTNERIEIAQLVSEEINEKFELSLFEMSLNALNQNICIKMLKSEATEAVLSAINHSLCVNYHTTFIFKSTPILSGSYMDNPFQKKTALYHFEKV